MADLLQSAKLFEVSARLEDASNCLYLVETGQVDTDCQNSLKWAGQFLTQVDWTSSVPQEGCDGGLAVSATTTRPKFYAAINRIAPRFQEIGVNSERELSEYLRNVYSVLTSGGTKSKMGRDELKVLEELLHLLSQSIIVELSNNGLPRRSPFFAI